MLKLDKFFGCCPMKTGASVLGIVIIIWGFMLAVFGCVGLMYVTLKRDTQLALLPDPGLKPLFSGIGLDIDFDKNLENGFDNNLDNDVDNDLKRKKMTAFFAVILTLGILEILAASSLLLGAVYNKPHFIVPMLILFPVDIALWIISISILCYRWFGIVFLVILIPIYVYFWVSIFSYWRQMKEKPRRAFRNWETGVVHEAPAVQETTVV